MKKRSKVALILVVGALLVIAGGMMFVFGMTSAGWDFKKLDREVLTEASFSTESAIDTVVLKGGSSWNYEITRGEQFSVRYYESNLFTIEAIEQDGVFTLNEEYNFQILMGFNGIVRAGLTVSVTVTDDIALEMQGSSAKVRVINADADSGVRLRSVFVKGSSSDLILENVAVDGAVTLQGSSADMVLKNCSVAGAVVLDGSSAKGELFGVTADSVVIDGSSAKGELSNVTTGSVLLDGSSAKLKLSGDSLIRGTLTMDGSSAKATIEHSAVYAIQAKGSSADVIARYADIGSLTGTGSSLEADLEIIGSSADLHSATASGSSAKVFVDGAKGTFIGTGHKMFSVSGSSADLKLKFLGGISQF